MKKLFLILMYFNFAYTITAQTGGDYIYVNPSTQTEGVMYKTPDGTGKYVVLPKNTLYSISKMHGMTVEELKSMNGIAGTSILIGQKLNVKETKEVGSGLNIGQKTSGEVVAQYLEKDHLQLKSDGNLEISASHPAILRAQKLVEEKEDLDKLKGTHLQRGREWWYVATDDDNFHKIATKYDMSFDSLKVINEMNDYLYRKGMVLLVQAGKYYNVKAMPEIMPELPKEEINDSTQSNENTSVETEEFKKNHSVLEFAPKANPLPVEDNIEAVEEPTTERIDIHDLQPSDTIHGYTLPTDTTK